MKTFKLTLECHDGTWGQLDLKAENAVQALRLAAHNFDLAGAKALHLVDMSTGENE